MCREFDEWWDSQASKPESTLLDCHCPTIVHESGCFFSAIDSQAPVTPEPVTVTGKAWSYKRSCTHAQDEIAMSDGTVFYASAYFDKSYRSWYPDYAVYMDGMWTPECIAFHIGWPDYGLPVPLMDDVIGIAKTVIERAQSGYSVEIGCLGAHGRTGTFLAILELLCQGDNPDARKAIAHVRTAHCWKAVEGLTQEWYVEAVAAKLRGEEIPPKPVTPKPKLKKSNSKGSKKNKKGKK